MSIMADTRQQFLERWLTSEDAEAPVLLTGGDRAKLEQSTEDMAGREEVEVVKLMTEKPTISIEELREVLAAVVLTTLVSKRLVIIPAAERLSLPAANALLKSLEESSRTTRFLLTSTNPGRLLPTIRSRCQQVRVAPLRPSGYAGQATGDEIEETAVSLGERLREGGPSPELKLAFMRLRDYYYIKSLRGNEKLAKEVLFASLLDGVT